MDWKGAAGLVLPALLTAGVAIFTTFRRPLTTREDAAAKLTDIALTLAETSDSKYRDQQAKLSDIERRLGSTEDELREEQRGREHCERRYDALVAYLRQMGLNPPEAT